VVSRERERWRYLITQFIADCLRQKGFAGVSYRSSVGGGENLCIFDPEDFAFVEGSGEVFSIVSVDYKFVELPAMVEEDEDFALMKSRAPV